MGNQAVSIDQEFVALGFATEMGWLSRTRQVFLRQFGAEKLRGCETADSSAYDDAVGSRQCR